MAVSRPQSRPSIGKRQPRHRPTTLGAAGPVQFGSIADRGFFDEGYRLLAATLAVVVLLTLQLPKSSGS